MTKHSNPHCLASVVLDTAIRFLEGDEKSVQDVWERELGDRHCAHLTPAEIAAIRTERATENATFRALAQKYGISGVDRPLAVHDLGC